MPQRIAKLILLPQLLAELLTQLLAKLRNLRLLDIGGRDGIDPVQWVETQHRPEPHLLTNLRALLGDGRRNRIQPERRHTTELLLLRQLLSKLSLLNQLRQLLLRNLRLLGQLHLLSNLRLLCELRLLNLSRRHWIDVRGSLEHSTNAIDHLTGLPSDILAAQQPSYAAPDQPAKGGHRAAKHCWLSRLGSIKRGSVCCCRHGIVALLNSVFHFENSFFAFVFPTQCHHTWLTASV